MRMPQLLYDCIGAMISGQAWLTLRKPSTVLYTRTTWFQIPRRRPPVALSGGAMS